MGGPWGSAVCLPFPISPEPLPAVLPLSFQPPLPALLSGHYWEDQLLHAKTLPGKMSQLPTLSCTVGHEGEGSPLRPTHCQTRRKEEGTEDHS